MIEFIGISKSYNESQIVDNITFTCKSGTINCLVGKNGAGKSTLINIASGLLKPSHGKIKILGEEINRKDRRILEQVGFVFESSLIIEQFSALEQLQLLGALYRVKNLNSRIDFLLAFFELPTNNKKKIYQYSTGMKSKISLACALIHSPKVLILDEPFAGLDIASYDTLLEFLKEYALLGNTVLITTHQVDIIVEISNFITIIKHGRLTHDLPFSALLKRATDTFGSGERSAIRKYIRKILN